MKFRFSNVSKRFLSEDTMLKYYGDSITLRRPFLFKFRKNFHSLRVRVKLIKSGDHRGNYLLLAPKQRNEGDFNSLLRCCFNLVCQSDDNNTFNNA